MSMTYSSHSLHSDNTILCLASGSDSSSNDSFEDKLISAKSTRCRNTAKDGVQACDQTAKCSSPSTIPAPKIWRRGSKKLVQDTEPCIVVAKPEMLKQFDMSEEHQITVPSFGKEPKEMDEWARNFISLIGLNDT
jgi:hypothetical protein